MSEVRNVEWASLGLLGVTILTPALPVAGKLGVAAVCASELHAGR